VRAELRGKLEERLIAATRSSQLHGAVFARDNDSGHAGQAERCSVAQQATARLAMIHANRKARYRSAGQKNEVVCGEEFVNARAEGGVTEAQCRDLVGGDAGSPSEAISDYRFKTIEVAGVNLRRFGCLKA
jgi:hypothetical protein